MNDERLEKAIAAHTRRSAAAAPAFDALLRRPTPNPGRHRAPLAVAAGIAVVALAALLVMMRDTTPTEAQMRALAGWTAPTDVFLPSRRGGLSAPPPIGQQDLSIYNGNDEEWIR